LADLVLKVDVDTWRGTREGVPALQRLFDSAGVPATFLFSLGPDRTGRAIRRALRPGFFSKVARTSVLEHYGWRTLLYGTLLPAPDVGRREAGLLRSVRDAGHECGVHCWDHTTWQDFVATQSYDWTRRQMRLAVGRFAEVFGDAPRVHGAAGWQMNRHAYALLGELGFMAASDTRGLAPYQPVDASGRELGVPQLPTSLPTLDELIGLDGVTADTVHNALLARTASTSRELEVYTLHAELEGQRLLPVMQRLLDGWRAQGHRFVTLGAAAKRIDPGTLPRLPLRTGEVPGRSGTLEVQAVAVEPARHS
jgi:undecaprenyl phosphate-alpha-L-ara4FN deformylase